MDIERRLVTLIQHYLHERGWTLALQALEEDTQVRFEPHSLPSGALVALVAEHDAAVAAHELSQVSLNTRKQRAEDAALAVQGDRRIPNAPERVLEQVHPANVITVRPSVHRPWLVTGGADRAVRVHDLQTGAQLHTFLHHRAGVLAVDLHPLDPNLLLTASMDGTHHLLDLSRPSGDTVCQSWKDHTKFIVRIQWSPNGEYFATASYDRTACVYGRQPDGSYELRRRFHFAGTVEALAFTPDSASVAFTARNDNYLHYVQLSDMAPTRYNMNKNGDDFVSFVGMDLQVSPDGKYILVCTDKSRVILFRIHSAEQVMNFYGMDHSEFSQPRTAWHPSGKYFYCTSGEKTILAFELSSKSILYKLDGHTAVVRDLVYDRARDCLWSCSYDQSVRQWVLDDTVVPLDGRMLADDRDSLDVDLSHPMAEDDM